EFGDKKKITENKKVHSSIREKQLKIAELMNYKKNDNSERKNVDFNFEEQKDEPSEKGNKFSISNAYIAETLNKKLFQKSSTSKFASSSFRNKPNSDERNKVLILTKYKGTTTNKKDTNINKVSENYKNQLSNVFLLKNKFGSAKSRFFYQKKSSDISKKDYITRDNSTISNKNSKVDDINYKIGENSLMQGISRSCSHSIIMDDIGGGNDNNVDKHTKDNCNHNGGDDKDNDNYNDNNKNESMIIGGPHKHDYSNNSSSVKPTTCKKRRANFFLCFSKLKIKHSKRKNDLQCNSKTKKKDLSKEEENIGNSSSNKGVSEHPDSSKKNIKQFFCVK
ncbi:conserved Plasmodium protein, unknown function, partial [Plasmodium malariae]